MNDYSEDELLEMINNCAASKDKLNQREREMIDVAGDQLDKGIMISQKQIDWIVDINRRVS